MKNLLKVFKFHLYLSPPHNLYLNLSYQEYNKQREGTDIETALQEELSGNAEKLYLAIAR